MLPTAYNVTSPKTCRLDSQGHFACASNKRFAEIVLKMVHGTYQFAGLQRQNIEMAKLQCNVYNTQSANASTMLARKVHTILSVFAALPQSTESRLRHLSQKSFFLKEEKRKKRSRREVTRNNNNNMKLISTSTDTAVIAFGGMHHMHHASGASETRRRPQCLRFHHACLRLPVGVLRSDQHRHAVQVGLVVTMAAQHAEVPPRASLLLRICLTIRVITAAGPRAVPVRRS